VKSEGRQMKQCSIKNEIKNKKNCTKKDSNFLDERFMGKLDNLIFFKQKVLWGEIGNITSSF
jgi:hypothetical protein